MAEFTEEQYARQRAANQIHELEQRVEDAESVIESINSLHDGALDEVRAERDTLREMLITRTIALQCAIGMVQDGVLQSSDTYNRWRKALGWHDVEI